MEWYYENNGQPCGPIGEADLAAMLATNVLAPDTRVWTATFGNEWKPASQTHLAPRQNGPMPPPIPVGVAAFVQQPPQMAYGQQGIYIPPYQPPTDTYAYWLAFSPLLMLALDLLIFNASDGQDEENIMGVSSVAGFWLSILFSSLDARNLYRSGRNPQHRTMVPFVLLTAIAYFWRREVVAGLSGKFILIWIACTFAWLAGAGLMLEP